VEQNLICPICSAKDWKKQLSCKDYTVSGKAFDISECSNCGLWATTDAPGIEEIGAYYNSEEYISHSDTRKGLLSKIYQAARKKALKWKLRITGIGPDSRVLDYGCGTGHFLYEASLISKSVVGVEPDAGAGNIASQKGLKVYATENRLEIPETFDIITLWHVLEHLHNLKEDIDWLLQKLDKSGKLYIAVPNRKSADAEIYGEFWAAYDVPRHLWHFTQEDLIKLFGDFGMQLKETIPMKMDAYYVSMLSNQYKGKSKWFGVLNGWKSNKKGRQRGFSSMVYVFGRAN
jgi:SAM-dependent methyltransferase